ncbi:hypothetical protein BHM03_00057398 [Ensete ventricosum]|nr:hypothetical protein BHM03_00057398 [Ensete ventricosum]
MLSTQTQADDAVKPSTNPFKVVAGPLCALEMLRAQKRPKNKPKLAIFGRPSERQRAKNEAMGRTFPAIRIPGKVLPVASFAVRRSIG